VIKAGTTIFAMSVILWALEYYPRLPEANANAIHNAGEIASVARQVFRYNCIHGSYIPDFDYDHINGGVVRISQRALFQRVLQDPYYIDWLGGKSAFEAELAADADKAVAAAQSEYSFAGRFGHGLEPVIKPLGYNWKMGVGLVGAFAARETFVSTEGIIYATGGDTDAGTGNLQQAMQNEKYANGKPVWTPLVAISLLIWFVLAMQCMSTVAIVKRETGGWGWPIFMTLYMNGLAYVLCLLVFQVGTHVFHL
jgi:Fe2+ transport system protein B